MSSSSSLVSDADSDEEGKSSESETEEEAKQDVATSASFIISSISQTCVTSSCPMNPETFYGEGVVSQC